MTLHPSTAEVSYSTPPGPVQQLTATPQESPALQSIVVDWTPPADGRFIDHYIVYASPEPDFGTGDATLVDEAPVSRYVHAGLGPDPETWHYRVVAIDAAGNVGTFEESAQVSATTGQAFVVGATSSSDVRDIYAARFAVDSSMSSRWAAKPTDDEWLQVELARPVSAGRVELYWQGAYAIDYDVLVSPDGDSWTVAHQVRGKATADTEVHDVSGAGEFRFVRMHGLRRATQWGYSIWEFWVVPA